MILQRTSGYLIPANSIYTKRKILQKIARDFIKHEANERYQQNLILYRVSFPNSGAKPNWCPHNDAITKYSQKFIFGGKLFFTFPVRNRGGVAGTFL
jgi:hypothetical protein